MNSKSAIRSAITALALLTLVGCSALNIAKPNVAPLHASCVLIDTDYDIDDMMAIPLVIGNKHVAGIITSEGYTLPEAGAAALSRLIAEPGQRQIPVIIGARYPGIRDLSPWPWLPFFRDMMNQSNGLMSGALIPSKSVQSNYTQRVVEATAQCRAVSVLIIGTYTSFINYSHAIRPKIDRVVIMGKPIGDPSLEVGKYSFNCRYDLPACQTAMTQLQGMNPVWVDIPRLTKQTPPLPATYESSKEMVEGGVNGGGLVTTDLPGALRRALVNSQECTSKYYGAMPVTPGAACSSYSTWVPADVAAGPGGESLLWDQTAALYLLHPEIFSPLNQHVVPTIVNGSHEQTAERLRRLWTEDTNRAVVYK